VVVQTLGGGRYGILAPPSGRLELSSDGETYRQVAEAALEEPARDTSVALGMQFGLGKAERARFVRVRLAPSPQWTMVSEVSVR
jgi:hypothetical protein